jgi:amino acid permease
MERAGSVGSLASVGSSDASAVLLPPMGDPRRSTGRASSVFNLVATMVGGGSLSIPFALAQTGVALGVGYLGASAAVSVYTFRLLLSCSRRSGGQTYEECGERAFGRPVKLLTMWLVFFMTFLAAVAYGILARDLASPLVENYILGHASSTRTHNLIALCLIGVVSPLTFLRSLHQLSYSSLVSMCALSFLSVVMVVKCAQKAEERPIHVADLRLASADALDSLYALPIMNLSFMAHFNVLPVHVSLRKPTAVRVRLVVSATILTALCFYLVVGNAGYLYAFDAKPDGVPDNILKAFPADDDLVNAGRLAFLTAIMMSFPLLMLPCRDTLLRLLDEWHGTEPQGEVAGPGSAAAVHVDVIAGAEYARLEEERAVLGVSDGGAEPDLETVARGRARSAAAAAAAAAAAPLPRRHYVTTMLLLVAVLVFMFGIPGVSIVWSVLGSTVGFLLAFVLPAAFYLRIRSPYSAWYKPGGDSRQVTAWVLLVVSSIMTVVCTSVSIYKIATKK